VYDSLSSFRAARGGPTFGISSAPVTGRDGARHHGRGTCPSPDRRT
jgi:hypothetical protein